MVPRPATCFVNKLLSVKAMSIILSTATLVLKGLTCPAKFTILPFTEKIC